MKRIGGSLLLLAVYLATAGYDACSGNILHDDGFDLWCGDQLCSWKLEQGRVAKAPTWNAGDYGVALVGDDVAISQVSDITQSDVSCVRFALVADIALDAQVTLTMDLYGDGEIDYSQQLPTSNWAPLEYLVTMPSRYQGIRFRLHKTGPGRAVLAQIKAVRSDQCTAEPLPDALRPRGAMCGFYAGDWGTVDDVDATCASALCAFSGLEPGDQVEVESQTCGDCNRNADCDGQACGVEARVASFLAPYRTCVPLGRHLVGERCVSDEECATSICNGGYCSACRSEDHPCGEGRQCLARDHGFLCDPGQGLGQPGEACMVDADCASGTCAGGAPLLQCQDGRLCDLDADCPEDGTTQGEFGSCLDYGVAGGRCR